MAHAEICPVCNGKGKVMEQPTTNPFPTKTCHGCSGKGWVTVGTEYPAPIMPPPIQPDDDWPPKGPKSKFDGISLSPFEGYTSSGDWTLRGME